jgi:hypothetical protein
VGALRPATRFLGFDFVLIHLATAINSKFPFIPYLRILLLSQQELLDVERSAASSNSWFLMSSCTLGREYINILSHFAEHIWIAIKLDLGGIV